VSEVSQPTGWETCRYDAMARVISGENQKKVESPPGAYPIYGSGGSFGRSIGYLCEAGTMVIGRKGTINRPIFVNERFWNVDTAFGLCPIDTDALLPRLLYYFCRSFNFKILDKSTTIPSLAKGDIEAITSPLPPLPEQKRIVAKIEELFSELEAGEAIQHCRYDDSEAKLLPPPFRPRPSIEIKDGDFLMTRKGPRTRAGVGCYVGKTRPFLMVCDPVYRFRCIEAKVHPLYSELALNSPDVLRAIDRQKAGISESGLSLTHTKIGAVEIPLCSIPEQQEIVRLLDAQFEVIEQNSRSGKYQLPCRCRCYFERASW
jgi:type I restriction enzyme S subunit